MDPNSKMPYYAYANVSKFKKDLNPGVFGPLQIRDIQPVLIPCLSSGIYLCPSPPREKFHGADVCQAHMVTDVYHMLRN